MGVSYDFNDKDDMNITLLYGGANAGKSYGMAKSLVEKASQKKMKIVVLRKVGTTIKNSVWRNLLEFINDDWKITKSKFRLEHKNGSVIECKTPVKIQEEYDEYWWEEANEFNKEDFVKFSKRGVHTLTFNPIRKDWIYELRDKARLIHKTYKDNPCGDEKFNKQLESLKDIDETFHGIYCLGVW